MTPPSSPVYCSLPGESRPRFPQGPIWQKGGPQTSARFTQEQDLLLMINILCNRRSHPEDDASAVCNPGARPHAWERTQRGGIRPACTEAPTARSAHTDALIISMSMGAAISMGGAGGPGDAVLDGGLDPVEFSPAITARTSEPVGVAAGRKGLADSGDRCPVFARRSGAHQQPDCKMDAGIASSRLERAGTSPGSVALVPDGWTDGGIRDSGRQRGPALTRIGKTPVRKIPRERAQETPATAVAHRLARPT
jgi:hypothetical protein